MILIISLYFCKTELYLFKVYKLNFLFIGHGHSHGGHAHDKHNLPTLEDVLAEGDINDNRGNFQVPLPDSKVPAITDKKSKKECKFRFIE